MPGKKFEAEFRAELKKNLIDKVNKYISRSPDERCSVVIFTDKRHINEWRGVERASIHTDEPLPPIPKNYTKEKYGQYINYISKVTFKYMRSTKKPIACAMYDTGNERNPQVHLLFCSSPLEMPGTEPDQHASISSGKTSITLLSKERLCTFSTIDEVSPEGSLDDVCEAGPPTSQGASGAGPSIPGAAADLESPVVEGCCPSVTQLLSPKTKRDESRGDKS